MLGRDRRSWKLFVRYFAGECDERERAEVEAAVSVDESRRRLFDDLEQIWNAAAKPAPQSDRRQAWQKLDDRIRQESKIKLLGVRPDRPSVSRTRRTRPAVPKLMLVALTLVVALLGGVFLIRGVVGPALTTPPLQPEVFATKRGQRATIQLTDGTRVHLNADSRFTAPERFDSDKREVHLEGEAFFEVARDSIRPFLVHTAHATVEVLGTSFDVSAYPSDEQARVVVEEGKVSVRGVGAGEEDAVVLNSRELGLVSGDAAPVVQRDVDLDRFLGWREGRLVFRNSSLEEVATQLERRYGIEVELVGSSDAADGLSATFTDEPFSEVIKSIATTLNLQYTTTREKITFFAHGAGM